MIDEDDSPIQRTSDELIEIDAQTQTFLTPPKTATASDPQHVQGSKADMWNDYNPQPEHDEVGKQYLRIAPDGISPCSRLHPVFSSQNMDCFTVLGSMLPPPTWQGGS